MKPALQTYKVTFTERTDYVVPVMASSPLEAARLVRRQYDDEGPENLEPQFSEATDWSVCEGNRNVTDIDDDQLMVEVDA